MEICLATLRAAVVGGGGCLSSPEGHGFESRCGSIGGYGGQSQEQIPHGRREHGATVGTTVGELPRSTYGGTGNKGHKDPNLCASKS